MVGKPEDVVREALTEDPTLDPEDLAEVLAALDSLVAERDGFAEGWQAFHAEAERLRAERDSFAAVIHEMQEMNLTLVAERDEAVAALRALVRVVREVDRTLVIREGNVFALATRLSTPKEPETNND